MTDIFTHIKSKCHKKIKSQEGASLILALVGFLIVCFVAIAIVNASILNARRTVEEKKEEVAYIATTEAARLIQECLEEDVTYKKVEGEESEITGADRQFGDTLKDMADSVSGGSGSQAHDIDFSYSGLEKIHGSLKGRMTMDESYTVEVDIWVESGDSNYPLTIVIPGEGNKVKEEIPGEYDANGDLLEKEVTYASWSGEGSYIISKIKSD
ncbi:hypothetical protein [Butyrivibrio sp. JL13D10]|uniref:hypothetical protein n=1 Tax=Butyrivibrio sp. JL13D10 TaxID=3236815 RepID=UPI0038B45882